MFSFRTKLSMLKALFTKKSPFYVQFYVSKYCHLKCKMCNIVEANSDLKPFSKDKIELIADNLKRIGVGVVLLTGGEPYLRPDIAEIVKALKSRSMDVRLQTSGLYSKKQTIFECTEYGAKDINVSLDSLDEELSDYINGLKGSWQDAIKTISFISKNFPQKTSICALGCVLSHYNIEEINAIIDFAKEINWYVSLVPVHITEPDNPMNFRGYDDNFKFHEEDFPRVKELIEELKIKKRKGYPLFDSDDYLDSIIHFVKTGQPNWRKNNVCDSPNLYFAILPDGSFAPCCDYRLNDKIYVYDEKFPEIYKSKTFYNKVKNIVQNCPGCNFGSFPEMTLSARSFSTIKERIFLQFKAGKNKFKPLEENEIFEIIEKIKSKYDIYKNGRKFNFRETKYFPKND